MLMTSRLASREQPLGRVELSCDADLTPPWKRAQKTTKRFGHEDVFLAQPDEDIAVALDDIRSSQSGDVAQSLGVDDHQRSSDSVAGVDHIVVEKPTRQRPAGLVVDATVRRRIASQDRDQELGTLLSTLRPDNEAADLVAGLHPARKPYVDIALSERRQGLALVLEPRQEAGRLVDLGHGVLCAADGQPLQIGLATSFAHHRPSPERTQGL
jgi:hypothetical protein